MAKKRSKKPAASRMVVRPTEAPMMVTRPAEPLSVDSPAPEHADIARLAFTRFAARGYIHGFQMEDWLAAEAELSAH